LSVGVVVSKLIVYSSFQPFCDFAFSIVNVQVDNFVQINLSASITIVVFGSGFLIVQSASKKDQIVFFAFSVLVASLMFIFVFLILSIISDWIFDLSFRSLYSHVFWNPKSKFSI
jgi:hypothetical protein